MTEHATYTTRARATQFDLRATIHQGPYGGWFVKLEGNGYPEPRFIDETPVKDLGAWLRGKVERGYRIVDPLHYLDCRKVPGFYEPAVSAAAEDRDSAGYPDTPLSYADADTFGAIEAAYFDTLEDSND